MKKALEGDSSKKEDHPELEVPRREDVGEGGEGGKEEKEVYMSWRKN